MGGPPLFRLFFPLLSGLSKWSQKGAQMEPKLSQNGEIHKNSKETRFEPILDSQGPLRSPSGLKKRMVKHTKTRRKLPWSPLGDLKDRVGAKKGVRETLLGTSGLYFWRTAYFCPNGSGFCRCSPLTEFCRFGRGWVRKTRELVSTRHSGLDTY